MRTAIIGAGISGLSVGRLLQEKGHETALFERDNEPGGLIRCKRVDGSLYHICGGHVFNTKRADVMDRFWQFFNRDEQFVKADRNSVVFLPDGRRVPYPIENHAYLLPEETQKSFVNDLLAMAASRAGSPAPDNFEAFLTGRFGPTLYELYFRPYNEKVWRRDLSRVPISWLEGKLPMPTVEEMIFNNMNHVEEKQFVHSSFWYERQGGSQLIVDTFARGLDIRCGFDGKISRSATTGRWTVGGEEWDRVVFCGNIKTLPGMLEGVDISAFTPDIEALESHGTTSVFCEIDANPYSWIYLPDRAHKAHRIICTGNFSPSNNAPGKMTATVEFTDEATLPEILDNLQRVPLNPRYLAHHYSPYTYPIQDARTRSMIASLKEHTAPAGLYLTGRFADWEYYNMDAALGAAMDLCAKL